MKRYRLLGADGVLHESDERGTLGGNARLRIYGRLDCPSALRALAWPDAPYRRHRVFFRSEAEAIAAGFRPCGRCLRERYREWARGPGEGRHPWRHAGTSPSRADGG
jgi:hypothetical protein